MSQVPVLTALALLAGVFFVVAAHSAPVLFSAHPLAMLLGMGVLPTIAIGEMRLKAQARTTAEKETRVKNHIYVQLGAVVTTLVGFAAIYVNKERNGRDHFQTTHAYWGLAALCMVGVMAPMALYTTFFASKRTQYLWRDLNHRVFGYAVVTVAGVATYFGMQSLGTLDAELQTTATYACATASALVVLSAVVGRSDGGVAKKNS